jgi:murein DD-endopeptidase MepM/ murein hydrolase activator NlpD
MTYIFKSLDPNMIAPIINLVPKFDFKNKSLEDPNPNDLINKPSDNKNIIAGTNNTWKNFTANPGFSTLKVGESLPIGNDAVTITDGYGIRNFKGRVGQHSSGIDFKTKSGNAVALKDGVITDVKLQGDGSVISPSAGKAAGYYVIVKHTDGSYGQYMHLDPMTTEEMTSLKNKELKRGDKIFGYTKGSGSMKGTHVKFRIYGDDPHINIDPSQAIRGENYSFIPNKRGENIIKS